MSNDDEKLKERALQIIVDHRVHQELEKRDRIQAEKNEKDPLLNIFYFLMFLFFSAATLLVIIGPPLIIWTEEGWFWGAAILLVYAIFIVRALRKRDN